LINWRVEVELIDYPKLSFVSSYFVYFFILFCCLSFKHDHSCPLLITTIQTDIEAILSSI